MVSEMTTVRLSEQRVQRLEAWAGEAMGEFVSISDIAIQFAELRELIRGYRRASALEDMLREWFEDVIAPFNPTWCGFCHRPTSHGHHKDCLVPRTEALLAGGDE